MDYVLKKVNYAMGLMYLSNRKLDGYIPSETASQKLKGKTMKDPFEKENLFYDPEKDEFICPNNERITFRYSYLDRSKKKTIRIGEQLQRVQVFQTMPQEQEGCENNKEPWIREGGKGHG